MSSTARMQGMKRVDPICKRLHIERYCLLFIFACMLCYIGVHAVSLLAVENRFMLFGLLLISGGIGFLIIYNRNMERKWWRIWLRRLHALDGLRFPQAARQPSVHESEWTSLPTTFRLRWERQYVRSGLITFALLLVVLALIEAGLAWFQSGSIFRAISGFFLFLGIMLAGYTVLLVLLYFLFMRYLIQSVKLTHEGITTYYSGQTRLLLWEEARVFAVYASPVADRSLQAQIYELSNERVVIRWSSYRGTSLTEAVSSTEKQEAWDLMIRRVNAVVAARTGLPLLDFDAPDDYS